MFKPAGVVDEPFLQHGIPLITDPLVVRRYFHRSIDFVLVAGKPILQKLKPPFPVGSVRLHQKTLAIELSHPLLARITSLQNSRLIVDRIRGVAVLFVFSEDGGPVGAGKAFGRLVKFPGAG